MQFTDTLEMIDEIQYAVERHVQGLRRVTANELGLDIRAGRVYVNKEEEVIAVECSRSIDYYGGFEYIKEGEGRTTCGSYTFFNTESSRVQECFDYLNETEESVDE
jgi:hypothetical protein